MNLTIVSYLLLAIVIAEQVADIWTTWHVLRLGGRERNALLRWLMDRAGRLTVLLLVKALFLAALIWACVDAGLDSAGLITLLVVIALGYAWVLRGNVRALQEQRLIASAGAREIAERVVP